MQAFNALNGGSGQPSDEMQARFARAVSHLQLLGLVKATARKTDHLQRLSFTA